MTDLLRFEARLLARALRPAQTVLAGGLVPLEAWQSAWPAAPALHELVEHWTVPAFADDVARLLQRAADMAPAGAEADAAERAFVEVAGLERASRDGAFPGDAQ